MSAQLLIGQRQQPGHVVGVEEGLVDIRAQGPEQRGKQWEKARRCTSRCLSRGRGGAELESSRATRAARRRAAFSSSNRRVMQVAASKNAVIVMEAWP